MSCWSLSWSPCLTNLPRTLQKPKSLRDSRLQDFKRLPEFPSVIAPLRQGLRGLAPETQKGRSVEAAALLPAPGLLECRCHVLYSVTPRRLRQWTSAPSPGSRPPKRRACPEACATVDTYSVRTPWHVPHTVSQSGAHGGMDHVAPETLHRRRRPNLGSVYSTARQGAAESGLHGSRAARSFPSSRKRPAGASTDKPQTKAQVSAPSL